MSDQVGREPQYDMFADEYLGHAKDGFFNAYYDRPACLSLLGDVAGRRILDAACGPLAEAAARARRSGTPSAMRRATSVAGTPATSPATPTTGTARTSR